MASKFATGFFVGDCIVGVSMLPSILFSHAKTRFSGGTEESKHGLNHSDISPGKSKGLTVNSRSMRGFVGAKYRGSKFETRTSPTTGRSSTGRSQGEQKYGVGRGGVTERGSLGDVSWGFAPESD